MTNINATYQNYLLIISLISFYIYGCGTIAPQVTYKETLEATQDVSVYVIAARQKKEIIASLKSEGIMVVENRLQGSYLLRVTLGVEQGYRDCGKLSNVIYALRHDKRSVLEIRGKGWTGTCDPNILEDMSRKLREALSS